MFKLRIFPFLLCFSLLQSSPIIPNAFAQESTTKEFEQAERAFEAYKFGEAQALYGQALQKYRHLGNLAAYIENQIAKCLRYQKKTEEAVAAYRSIKERYPESPLAGEVQEAVARTYYEAGDYAKAGPEFEKLGEEMEAEVKKTSETQMIKGAAVPEQNVKEIERKEEKCAEAYGYAAYCYKKTGKIGSLLKANHHWQRVNKSHESRENE